MDDDLLIEFINESREHLATIETDLLVIEAGGANIDEALVNKVFRAAHSIKGGSSFFGLEKVKELAHRAETVLDMLRSRKMPPNAEVTNVLLAAFDQLRSMINQTDSSEQVDIADLLVSLTGLASSYLPVEQKASLHTLVKLNAPSGEGQIQLHQADIDRAQRNGHYIYWVDCDLVHDIEKKGQNILVLFKKLAETGEILDCTVDTAAVGTLDGPVGNRVPLRLVVATDLPPNHIDSLFETIESDRIYLLLAPQAEKPQAVPVAATLRTEIWSAPPVKLAETAPVLQTKSAPEIKSTPEKAEAIHARVTDPSGSGVVPEETLRVNVGLLETLMNLTGELVLSRNQLRAAVAQNNRQLLAAVDQRVNQVTSELQEVIMQTRLQPIGNVFAKFSRMVRDLSRTLGKEIQLDIVGKDVALDKTLIEGLSDPLTHMVRNAVDHGIENTEERLRAGKHPAGKVRIEARYEAGQVVVEIADDGKGLDPQKLTAAAINKGLITAEKSLGLSEQDKLALIFLPGFSTAQKVTDVSGRGVGMDVVKTNLDRLGGQVEILSTIGKGSTFRIKLPLTLAIIPSLIISVENERFAIPQANIEELLRLRPEEVKKRIELVGDAEVLLLRDRMLPLVRFADILGAVPSYVDSVTSRRETDRRIRLADRRSPRYALNDTGDSEQSLNPESLYRRSSCDRRQTAASALGIAVVTTGMMSFGLVVDAFHDTEEVVVKPLGSRLKHLREYSGATILGDGTVVLILDVAGLATKAGLASVSGSARATELAAEAEAQRLQDLHSLLLFYNGADEPCAVPLDIIQRIEHIHPGQIEHLGRHRTMRYRGSSLPLVTLSDAAPVASLDTEKNLVVLVSSVNGREVGLLGALPVDVIETRAVIDQLNHRQKGIAGSIILHDRTILIVDLYELVDTVHPDWGATRTELRTAARGPEGATTVLLAEDSDFFRAQVKKYLEEDGFKVLAAPDGEAAWELLRKNLGTVRIVITDIEMPRLTGLGLATRIRADARTAELPIIAVTALAGDEDAARGHAAGITEYQVKLDRDKLLASVHDLLAVARAC
ncbi:MAG: chemotaxis protein CheW [Geoalkalibacter sp.]|jgi:two-component system chemotaxis sensor kinase CheA|uniref:hybrid sensor histidine kinase/response regulator n=1 Tax=Geoalkalibacter sp. TaxID=3041440 RepID=UPI002A5058EA|nr:chemotaxis protein CheW [Desulfofustis sp.]